MSCRTTISADGPAIVIVGSVVTLRERLSWFKPAKTKAAESLLSCHAENLTGTAVK